MIVSIYHDDYWVAVYVDGRLAVEGKDLDAETLGRAYFAGGSEVVHYVCNISDLIRYTSEDVLHGDKGLVVTQQVKRWF